MAETNYGRGQTPRPFSFARMPEALRFAAFGLISEPLTPWRRRDRHLNQLCTHPAVDKTQILALAQGPWWRFQGFVASSRSKSISRSFLRGRMQLPSTIKAAWLASSRTPAGFSTRNASRRNCARSGPMMQWKQWPSKTMSNELEACQVKLRTLPVWKCAAKPRRPFQSPIGWQPARCPLTAPHSRAGPPTARNRPRQPGSSSCQPWEKRGAENTCSNKARYSSTAVAVMVKASFCLPAPNSVVGVGSAPSVHPPGSGRGALVVRSRRRRCAIAPGGAADAPATGR